MFPRGVLRAPHGVSRLEASSLARGRSRNRGPRRRQGRGGRKPSARSAGRFYRPRNLLRRMPDRQRSTGRREGWGGSSAAGPSARPLQAAYEPGHAGVCVERAKSCARVSAGPSRPTAPLARPFVGCRVARIHLVREAVLILARARPPYRHEDAERLVPPLDDGMDGISAFWARHHALRARLVLFFAHSLMIVRVRPGRAAAPLPVRLGVGRRVSGPAVRRRGPTVRPQWPWRSGRRAPGAS